jgi:hypothetical protein
MAHLHIDFESDEELLTTLDGGEANSVHTSPSITTLTSTSGVESLTALQVDKAGLENVDKEKINKVIYEISKVIFPELDNLSGFSILQKPSKKAGESSRPNCIHSTAPKGVEQ